MNALLLLITLTTSTLVLRTGERIAVEGTPRTDNGVVTFRSAGLLYSMPAEEIVRIEETASPNGEKAKRKLAVSEEERKRLIEELEQNHSGQPAPPPPAPDALRAATAPEPTPPPDPGTAEAEWRRRAREHEENIRRAQEEVTLLENRIAQLQSEINTFFTLGFRPSQFTYQTTQIARAQEQLPAAQLEVTRAERAFAEFREDARKAGVLPGWLR